MKYSILLNQKRACEWGLTSSEAIVFSWIYELPSWADKLVLNEETYYYGSRNMACVELPIVTDKHDTMYRIYKSLQKKGLINVITIQKKDYISLSERGKQWHFENELPIDGIKSEKTRNKIRENSEINPTNKYNNNNKEINNQENKEKEDKSSLKKSAKFDFKASLIALGVNENVASDWMLVRKQKKAANTETAFNRIKSEISKANLSANECITLAVERSWQGFRAEWADNLNIGSYSHSKRDYGTKPNIKLNPNLHIVDDEGTLNDGTFVKNGYRYYFSKMSKSAVSIPPIAEPMPKGNDVEYDMKLGWYECE